MQRDLHKSGFDQGTLVKLRLYQMYLVEWLPVFLRGRSPVNTVNIFDFFSGPGKSTTGQKGSPLITLEEVKKYYNDLKNGSVSLTLYFNEYKKDKFKELSKNLPDDTKLPFSIVKENLDFSEAFNLWLPKMKNAANLVFLDQNGMKQITKSVFNDLVNTKGVDFLFFISSSFIRRFGDTQEFQRYLGVSKDDVVKGGYGNVHRNITDAYRAFIPSGKEYYLAPFSIKKDANIYGLVFGTGAPLGILKFLTCSWKVDEDTGESNYDIDNDNLDPYRTGNQETLSFMKDLKATKVTVFEQELKQKILSGAFETDRAILLYALDRGFIGKHISVVIRQLKKEGHLKFTKKDQLRFSKIALNDPRKVKLLK